MFHIFFNSLARSRYLSLFSHSFSFILWCRDSKVDNFAGFLFFFFFCWLLSDLVFGPRLGDSKVPQEFVSIIFSVRCWVVLIPFVGMVKFKFLAYFPVDPLAHPGMSSFVLLLCQFAAFAYYVIDGLICHRIVFSCYFVVSYLSSLWYDWILWRCFVLQLGEILFLS